MALTDKQVMSMLIKSADPAGSFDPRKFTNPMPALMPSPVVSAVIGTHERVDGKGPAMVMYPVFMPAWRLNYGPCPCGNHDRMIVVAVARCLN